MLGYTQLMNDLIYKGTLLKLVSAFVVLLCMLCTDRVNTLEYLLIEMLLVVINCI